MGRPRDEVVVTADERTELKRLTRQGRVNRALAFRARIVLACIESPDTVVVRRLQHHEDHGGQVAASVRDAPTRRAV